MRMLVCIPLVLAAVLASAGCADSDRVDPFIDFNTSTNVIVIDAPIDDRHRTEIQGHRGKFRYIFDFKITKGSHTDSSTVWVSRKVYDAYDEGDRIRLRCVPAKLCEVLP